jgi:hypothetical protein
MKINVQQRDDNGVITGEFSINRAEANVLIQYAINHYIAMGYVFDAKVMAEDSDDETVRFKQEVPTGVLN